MSREIPPVLSAAEWTMATGLMSSRVVHRGSVCCVGSEPGRYVTYVTFDGEYRAMLTIGANEGPMVIALSNAALPDDSPYKITQEDVRLLNCAARSLVSFGLVSLAAKLAALLPPETP